MKGVFINPALVEPFGLTLIEVSVHDPFCDKLRSYHCHISVDKYVESLDFLQAAAYGLPIVATKNGGPVDIVKVTFL